MFSIGIHNLVGRVALFDRPHVFGFRIAFRREPEWDFPLSLNHLLTAPLARPFADSGARYEVVIADTVGTYTEFQQRYAFDVEESPILRWVNRINSQINDAFSEPATAEANAFFASVLAAVRADIRASEGLAGGRGR
jgi:hypothetical protein